MGKCYFCETEDRESWGGYWCKSCRQIKNLGNVYGFERTLTILKSCCIRDETQLERKIEGQKKKAKLNDDDDDIGVGVKNTDMSYITRSKKNVNKSS
tara:strand:- start:14965 stop:15255 length:291 start_codon:yes stop_codon:yes gene_type:complete